MLGHKSYMDIRHIEPALANTFNKGDRVIIQEKIDGANASFQYDTETKSLVAFSRNKVLDLSNTLQGFYEYVQKLDAELIHKHLGDNLRIFGEWLVKHSVVYPTDRYRQMYCYDIYNTETQTYLPHSEVERITAEIGLVYVPVLYDGEFVSWEHCLSFVGQTKLGGEYGEGVVVKNNPDTPQLVPKYVKVVGQKFREVKGAPKLLDPELLKKKEEAQALSEAVVTEARVKKLVHKLVDDEIIPPDWNETHMKVISKNLPSAVFYDCLKEEPEFVNEIPDFGRYASSIAMRVARAMMEEKRNMLDV